MRKFALAFLILFIVIKSASASCEASQVEIEEIHFHIKFFFYSLIFVVLANLVLFFLRKQKDYFVLVVIILTTLVIIPVTLISSVFSGCGAALELTLKWEFIVFLTIFGFHICLWVNKTGLHLRDDRLTLIKLQ